MKISKEKLKECLEEHLPYEIDMLNKVSKIQTTNVNDLVYNNMVFESFAIHLRNLITFFYPKKRFETDIYAEDFFTVSEDWEKIRPDLSVSLKKAKERADKEVGHLTLERFSGDDSRKNWSRKELAGEIFSIVQLFYKQDEISRRNIS